jgi:DNA-binding CsgD family transcriptional regulator
MGHRFALEEIDTAWAGAARVAEDPGLGGSWVSSLAREIHAAAGALFADVTTCIPGNWYCQQQHACHPREFEWVFPAIRDGFAARISAAGDGAHDVIRRGELIHVHLERSRSSWRLEQVRREIAEQLCTPIGMRGHVAAYVVDRQERLLAMILIGSREPSFHLLERVRQPLEWIRRAAAETIQRALALSEQAGAQVPSMTFLAGLSPRERQIVSMAWQGISDGDIATRLQLSENTVGVHLSRVFRKLRIHSRVELMARAYPATVCEQSPGQNGSIRGPS